MNTVLPPFISYTNSLGMQYEAVSCSRILNWSIQHSKVESESLAYFFVPHLTETLVTGQKTIRRGVLVIPTESLIFIIGAWELHDGTFLPFPEYLNDPLEDKTIPSEIVGTLMAMGMLRGIVKCFWAKQKENKE